MTTKSKKLTLMGATEVAEFLGVSRQRVLELRRDHAEFPQPLEQLRSGPVWDKSDIESFLAGWDRTPGRPRRYPPALPPINQSEVTPSSQDEVASGGSETFTEEPEQDVAAATEEPPSEPEPVPEIPEQSTPQQTEEPQYYNWRGELLRPDNE